ncbi:MAG: F0F1 ATP synthase subunit gamma [Dysgonamonadaceae bacterium]|jgi:F-type H+-transporting ATPase subunit gamma|nr:F0F1 ATP synthase subunit gamma [Dysgonamonadaceae bacterium]
MSSLKEIKGRIASVKSTQKITSAMKMVASAKLRKAQNRIEQFLPYEKRLKSILDNFLASDMDSFATPLSEERETKRVAVVVLSSNSGLCGAFNSNILNLMSRTLDAYRAKNIEILVYPFGKKVEENLKKAKIPVETKGTYQKLVDSPDYEVIKAVADELIEDFLNKKIDRVDLVYNHFKNTAVQIPTCEQFLPLKLSKPDGKQIPGDYIVEPNRDAALNALLPKTLRSKVFSVLLDSVAAEHGARVMAMQIATDNADDLLEGLTIQLNKQRQQAITSELLDIIGGSEALK